MNVKTKDISDCSLNKLINSLLKYFNYAIYRFAINLIFLRNCVQSFSQIDINEKPRIKVSCIY